MPRNKRVLKTTPARKLGPAKKKPKKAAAKTAKRKAGASAKARASMTLSGHPKRVKRANARRGIPTAKSMAV